MDDDDIILMRYLPFTVLLFIITNRNIIHNYSDKNFVSFVTVSFLSLKVLLYRFYRYVAITSELVQFIRPTIVLAEPQQLLIRPKSTNGVAFTIATTSDNNIYQ